MELILPKRMLIIAYYFLYNSNDRSYSIRKKAHHGPYSALRNLKDRPYSVQENV
jgi:hypothetical protein